MRVVLLLPTGVTAFEALGPYGVFSRVDDARTRLIGDRSGRVPCHGSKLPLVAEASYLYVEPTDVADVLVVPGGMGVHGLAADETMLDWIRRAQAGAAWTIGISTGSVLLSAAGLLRSKQATTHWLATEMLTASGTRAVQDRLVVDDGIVTATGAVAGLDAALFVLGELRGADAASVVRTALGDDLVGRLGESGPTGSDVIAGIAGPTTSDGQLFADSAGSLRPTRRRRRIRATGRSRTPRWSRRSGRIDVHDTSPG